MKKILVTLIAGLTAVPLIMGGASIQTATSFKDVPSNHWAKTSIDSAVSKGYFKGYSNGTFKPSASVTRSEFASMLARVSKADPNVDKSNVFNDLSNHWSKKEVDRAVSLGFINPADYPNGFKPNTPITREEMAKWISSGLATADTDFKKALEDTKTTLVPVKESFSPGISEAKAPYISVVIGTGVMTGYPDNSFGMTKTTTRAEASVILLRIANMEGKKASSFSDLNEIRAVGITKSNLSQVTPFSTANDKTYAVISGKTKTLRNGAGKVVLHRTIYINTTNWTKKKSVYAPFFVSEENKDFYKEYTNVIPVFHEITIYPKAKNFSSDHIRTGLRTALSGQRITPSSLPEKYGYLTLPAYKSEQFFAKYSTTSGVKLWIKENKYVDQEGLIGMYYMDDGSALSLYNKQK